MQCETIVYRSTTKAESLSIIGTNITNISVSWTHPSSNHHNIFHSPPMMSKNANSYAFMPTQTKLFACLNYCAEGLHFIARYSFEPWALITTLFSLRNAYICIISKEECYPPHICDNCFNTNVCNHIHKKCFGKTQLYYHVRSMSNNS